MFWDVASIKWFLLCEAHQSAFTKWSCHPCYFLFFLRILDNRYVETLHFELNQTMRKLSVSRSAFPNYNGTFSIAVSSCSLSAFLSHLSAGLDKMWVMISSYSFQTLSSQGLLLSLWGSQQNMFYSGKISLSSF